MHSSSQVPVLFTSYQKAVIFVLALLQFLVILDFMIIAPIGDLLMKSLAISTEQFGLVVSSYAFSAAFSGIAFAGFADKYDRKTLLLILLAGFVGATLLCGLANSFTALLVARILTGIFAGLCSSTLFAVVADIFAAHTRGRVMGMIQMGFGLSQVLGIPLGLYVAARFNWHSTFMLIVAMSILLWLVVARVFEPIVEHLNNRMDKNAFLHLWHTLMNKQYQVGFVATTFLTLGGFMLMPFSSVFLVNNVRISHEQLPVIFLCTGISSLIVMPVIGKISDTHDRFRIFMFASLAACCLTVIYTHLTPIPFWVMVVFNMAFFAVIMSRMSPAMALNSMIAKPQDRGAYMSISSSLQQTAGGISAVLASWVVYQPSAASPIEHYDILGYLAVGVFLLSVYLVRRVDLSLKQQAA